MLIVTLAETDVLVQYSIQGALANGQALFQFIASIIPQIVSQPFSLRRVGSLETAVEVLAFAKMDAGLIEAVATVQQQQLAVVFADCIIHCL
ncbi:hypothetical protein [uncultured Reyranella sp.]|uniref:hypothetical protein n=1 Tax=uncultured Reyranella sp. TaxID=735512 RepID=UPI0025E20D4F|nr:hypothetical protein [uncultured Reyranella sp.]